MAGRDLEEADAFWRSLSRRWRHLALCGGVVAALAAAPACRDIVSPPVLPEGAVPLVAPSVYRQWWADAERCSGISADYARVQWFMVPNVHTFTYEGGRYDGVWWSYYHWIALAEGRVDDSLVVRHEMLHDLLGRGDHPALYFQQRCAAIVSCGAGCLQVDARRQRATVTR